MAETDGSIAIGIRLALDELKQQTAGVQATLDKMTAQFKAKGEEAGKVYVQGVGKGAAQLNNHLNGFVSSMQNISPKMGALGEKIASQFF
jgi:hypothetical protein